MTVFQESSVPGHLLEHLSKSAEDAEEPSIIEDKVKAEDKIEASCDDVDNAET